MLTHSESIANIAKALALAQTKMNAITRNKSVQVEGQRGRYSYTYAELADVVDAVLPALNSEGIGVIQGPGSLDDGTIIVDTMLVHESGEWMRCELAMKPTRPDPQGQGSAITYCRRYALMAIAGVAPEDDDGAAASAPPTKAQQKAAQTISPARVQYQELETLAGKLDIQHLGAWLEEHIAPDLKTRKPRILSDEETVAAKTTLQAMLSAKGTAHTIHAGTRPSELLQRKAFALHNQLNHSDTERHEIYQELFHTDSFKNLSKDEVDTLVTYLETLVQAHA